MDKKKYFTILTKDLKVNTVLNFNIYVKTKNSTVLFRKGNNPFSEETLNRLIDHKTDSLLISEEDRGEYDKYSLSVKDDSCSHLTDEGFASPIFDKSKNVEKYYKTYFNFFSIGRKTLVPGSKVNFNVYVKKEIDVELYFGPEKQDSTTDVVPDDIQKSDLPLVIKNTETHLYKKYIENVADEYSNLVLKTHSDYFPIEEQTLIPGSKVNFNIYKKKDKGVELYIGPEKQDDNQDVVPGDIQKSDLPLAIRNTDIPLYKEYLQDIAQDYLKLTEIPIDLKCSIVQENSKLIVKEILEGPFNAEKVEKSTKVVESLVETVFYVEDKFYNLLRITSDDHYAYTHALNVCTLCIGLGMAIKLEKTPDLMELGLGALLHDIGKSLISPYILNKPGRLTNEEFVKMQTHVVEGKDLLIKGNEKTPKNVFYPITQHHERLSGNGYPYKLKGEQIHLFGRITSIANFYDNLTTERPYKKAYTPYEALELMSENKEDFDQKLLVEFIKMIGLQKVN